VHGVDDYPPAIPVRVGSKPRLVEVALAEGRIGIDAFADDERKTTLGERCVVVTHQLVGGTFSFGADSGHGCDCCTIAQTQMLQCVGFEQLRHGALLIQPIFGGMLMGGVSVTGSSMSAMAGCLSPIKKRGRSRVAIGTLRSVRGGLQQKRRRFLHMTCIAK